MLDAPWLVRDFPYRSAGFALTQLTNENSFSPCRCGHQFYWADLGYPVAVSGCFGCNCMASQQDWENIRKTILVCLIFKKTSRNFVSMVLSAFVFFVLLFFDFFLSFRFQWLVLG